MECRNQYRFILSEIVRNDDNYLKFFLSFIRSPRIFDRIWKTSTKRITFTFWFYRVCAQFFFAAKHSNAIKRIESIYSSINFWCLTLVPKLRGRLSTLGIVSWAFIWVHVLPSGQCANLPSPSFLFFFGLMCGIRFEVTIVHSQKLSHTYSISFSSYLHHMTVDDVEITKYKDFLLTWNVIRIFTLKIASTRSELFSSSNSESSKKLWWSDFRPFIPFSIFGNMFCWRKSLIKKKNGWNNCH